MGWLHWGGARRAASCIAVGGLLGAATVAGTVMVSGSSAVASCTSKHENVNAEDAGEDVAYGNQSTIYVNSGTAISDLSKSIFRSIFVFGSAGNDVEVGWTANNGGHKDPVVYSEWVNRGADSDANIYTGYSLTQGNNYHFEVTNVNNIDIWRYYVGGQSTAFDYSPTMNFNYGIAVTNSERNAECDSMEAHFYNLKYAFSNSDWATYENLKCYLNNTTDWYYHKLSNSEERVNQTSGMSGTC